MVCSEKNGPIEGVVGKAFLPDFGPVYNYLSRTRGGGVLNIREEIGQVVPGVLFEIRPDGRATLDRKEGYPSVYTRIEITCLLQDGDTADAFTYMVRDIHSRGGFVKPSPDYVQIVRRGLNAHGVIEHLHKTAEKGANTPYLIDRIFCYGTLMSGESRGALLETFGKPEKRLNGVTPGRLYDLGGFPAMSMSSSSEEIVHGKLVQVKRIGDLLAFLDGIEGFRGYGCESSLFERRIVRVRTEAGDEFAWVYVMVDPGDAPMIVDGKWRGRSIIL